MCIALIPIHLVGDDVFVAHTRKQALAAAAWYGGWYEFSRLYIRLYKTKPTPDLFTYYGTMADMVRRLAREPGRIVPMGDLLKQG